jgi:threonine efflux protein
MSSFAVIVGALVIWGAAIVSPGPNFLVVSHLALARSSSGALGAAVGIMLGAATYAALTMFGLSLLVAHLAGLGDVLRIIGGLYLVWLGVKLWRNLGIPAEGDEIAVPLAGRGGFATGLLTALTNPKAIAFFVGLFAAAVGPGTPLWAKATILGGGAAMELGWYSAVALALALSRPRLVYRRLRRAIDRTFGSLLVIFGIGLLAEER